MNEQVAHRIARFHVSRSDCSPFPGSFAKDVWRGHFEWDRKRMRGRTHPFNQREVHAIERFLMTGTAEVRP